MTRSKRLVYEDVEAIFLDLIQSDRVPTTINIRDRLKRGSNTTILKYLNQAKDKHNYPKACSDADLWGKAMAQATALFTDERTAWEGEKKKILEKLVELELQRDTQAAQIEQLRQNLKNQEEAFKRLLRSFETGDKP